MDITEESSGCTIVDCASGEADTISVSLFNKSGKWFKKNYFPNSSDYIRATIVVDKWKNDSEHREVYQGKFVADQFAASGFPATVDLEGMSIPLHTGFNVTQRSKTYKKTSLKSILQIIAKRALKIVRNHRAVRMNMTMKRCVKIFLCFHLLIQLRVLMLHMSFL